MKITASLIHSVNYNSWKFHLNLLIQTIFIRIWLFTKGWIKRLFKKKRKKKILTDFFYFKFCILFDPAYIVLNILYVHIRYIFFLCTDPDKQDRFFWFWADFLLLPVCCQVWLKWSLVEDPGCRLQHIGGGAPQHHLTAFPGLCPEIIQNTKFLAASSSSYIYA